MKTTINTCRIDNNTDYKLFDTTEEAWFWFCRYQAIRDESGSFCRKSSYNTIQRPCDLDDIMRVVLKLKLSGKINQKHINVLLEYGKRFTTPDIHHPEEANDLPLWNSAIDFMKTILIKKGIVTCKLKN